MRIEKKLLFQRDNEDDIGLDPAAETFESGQGRSAVLLRPGKSFEKSVVTGKNCSRANDLPISLVDQFLEDLTAGAEAGFNLRKRMAAVRLPDDEVGRALQQGQKRNERKKKPAPETAESELQG